ncbi:VOC family protein [Roseofilum casamattae]|uniref:VOC family protein n=1 Tax=Roseofilum casamattae BLCC-M143 TaxID=3022442 RepID=A0ABT7BWS4_9CYAN|nr:VOC family protein [Roseofilum casamattae]MDJ1182723.1 VOC family protein [Roseofilum casamattae BLCC-M143]
MKVLHPLHTAILVSDLEKADHFYGTILSLEKCDRALKFPGIWYQIGEYQLHLMLNSDIAIARQNEQKWGRNAHIAFRVDSLQETKQRLIEYNCSFQLSSSGRSALFVEDPDGNILELSEG